MKKYFIAIIFVALVLGCATTNQTITSSPEQDEQEKAWTWKEVGEFLGEVYEQLQWPIADLIIMRK